MAGRYLSAVAVLGWAGAAWAGALSGPGSPKAALEALPAPPARAEEAQARWRGGADRAVEPVRRSVRRELERAPAPRERADRDPAVRRAAAQRLSPPELTALLRLEELRAAEPVTIARNVEQLARRERADAEEEARALAREREAGLQACGPSSGCRRQVEDAARAARVALLERLLSSSLPRWQLLRERLARHLAERQRLAERAATASGDPYVLARAQELVAHSWLAVAEVADELERQTALAAQLAAPQP